MTPGALDAPVVAAAEILRLVLELLVLPVPPEEVIDCDSGLFCLLSVVGCSGEGVDEDEVEADPPGFGVKYGGGGVRRTSDAEISGKKYTSHHQINHFMSH